MSLSLRYEIILQRKFLYTTINDIYIYICYVYKFPTCTNSVGRSTLKNNYKMKYISYIIHNTYVFVIIFYHIYVLYKDFKYQAPQQTKRSEIIRDQLIFVDRAGGQLNV